MSRKPYPTDLSDTQWKVIEPMIPPAKPGGRPRTVNMREIVNGILYTLRSGCAWRLMPHDLPVWSTVYDYFRNYRIAGHWQRIHDALRGRLRCEQGRQESPSAAIIDSQSVKTTEKGGVRGYDAGKKINGRKRHILVDTIGLVLAVVVHEASIQDRDGAKLVMEKIKGSFARLILIWADGGYRGKLVDWTKEFAGWTLEIVKRNDDVKGFKVLPRRWVVERTFGWLGRYRRLSKDYEQRTDHSEAMIHLAMINLMCRRLAAKKPM